MTQRSGISYLRALRYGAARALGGLRRAPTASLIAIGAVAVAFALLGLVHLAARNVSSMTSGWGKASMVVYLEDGTSAERAEEVRAALALLPAVERTAYVSQDAAFGRLRAALGEHHELIDGLEAGMLPTSIEVTLRAGVTNVVAARPVAQRLEAMDGIEEIEFTGEWVERQGALVSGLERASAFLLFLVGGACIYIVAATMRGRAHTRRREAEIMQLLGASAAFVRGPLLLEGALHGALGAGAAVVGLWLLYQATAGAISQVLSAAFGSVSLGFLPPAEMALLVAAGAGLGFVGSILATRHHASI